MPLLLTLAVLIAASATAPLLSRVAVGLRVFVLPIPALAAFLLLASAAPSVFQGNLPSFEIPWVPAIDLTFALQLNGWGLLLALLVTGIGALILTYATGYMGGHPQAARLYCYLYAFMFAMAGIAMADHLLLFFIFWELTSITSYLLIGFNHADPGARKNALQALLVTGLGGMALLAGFILMAATADTWLISELAAKSPEIIASPLYPAILALVLTGAFTKSAQFPFYFWLPNAMAAPTPVSAYLHSATMVKAGVFLMGLMLPVLGGTQAWTLTLTIAGGITLLIGGLFGMRQTDLKKILAGTTLAVLGMLTLSARYRHGEIRPRSRSRSSRPRPLQGHPFHGRRLHRSRNRHPRHAHPRRTPRHHALHRRRRRPRGTLQNGTSPALRISRKGICLQIHPILRRRHRPYSPPSSPAAQSSSLSRYAPASCLSGKKMAPPPSRNIRTRPLPPC